MTARWLSAVDTVQPRLWKCGILHLCRLAQPYNFNARFMHWNFSGFHHSHSAQFSEYYIGTPIWINTCSEFENYRMNENLRKENYDAHPSSIINRLGCAVLPKTCENLVMADTGRPCSPISLFCLLLRSAVVFAQALLRSSGRLKSLRWRRDAWTEERMSELSLAKVSFPAWPIAKDCVRQLRKGLTTMSQF